MLLGRDRGRRRDYRRDWDQVLWSGVVAVIVMGIAVYAMAVLLMTMWEWIAVVLLLLLLWRVLRPSAVPGGDRGYW